MARRRARGGSTLSPGSVCFCEAAFQERHIGDVIRRLGARGAVRRPPGAGPYRWWHHEHRFEAVEGGTRVTDHVEFVPRLRWLTGPLVARDVRRIFAYRTGELARIFVR